MLANKVIKIILNCSICNLSISIRNQRMELRINLYVSHCTTYCPIDKTNAISLVLIQYLESDYADATVTLCLKEKSLSDTKREIYITHCSTLLELYISTDQQLLACSLYIVDKVAVVC